ncbi:hypothetical protein ARMSODRAFT_983306 [Armillaria solidipes]|uniref:Uncharacterized protein n=1 Tax=Armillaria solidipes TaxID=1076256 RepID=A0A2H3AW50_9AGAR|nr:hypothetical protein ARMSODRAFT_983306 [Armillaria solidipes]
MYVGIALLVEGTKSRRWLAFSRAIQIDLPKRSHQEAHRAEETSHALDEEMKANRRSKLYAFLRFSEKGRICCGLLTWTRGQDDKRRMSERKTSIDVAAEKPSRAHVLELLGWNWARRLDLPKEPLFCYFRHGVSERARTVGLRLVTITSSGMALEYEYNCMPVKASLFNGLGVAYRTASVIFAVRFPLSRKSSELEQDEKPNDELNPTNLWKPSRWYLLLRKSQSQSKGTSPDTKDVAASMFISQNKGLTDVPFERNLNE